VYNKNVSKITHPVITIVVDVDVDVDVVVNDENISKASRVLQVL